MKTLDNCVQRNTFLKIKNGMKFETYRYDSNSYVCSNKCKQIELRRQNNSVKNVISVPKYLNNFLSLHILCDVNKLHNTNAYGWVMFTSVNIFLRHRHLLNIIKIRKLHPWNCSQ